MDHFIYFYSFRPRWSKHRANFRPPTRHKMSTLLAVCFNNIKISKEVSFWIFFMLLHDRNGKIIFLRSYIFKSLGSSWSWSYSSLNPAYGEVFSIQHYVIKFVSTFWLFCGFLPSTHWGKADDRNCNYGHLKMADVESGKNLFCRLNCFCDVF